MIMLLALPVIAAVALAHRYLRLHAPSNRLIARARSARPTLRLAVGLGLLAVVLIAVGHRMALAIEDGAPAWLNLAVLVLLWDAIKVMLVALCVLVRALAADVRCVLRCCTQPRRAWS